ncbi:MAG: imidazolonepropionase [Acidobacteria bacterium]|nr:imidazolonepropionase [Acidobacteriota bacterium]
MATERTPAGAFVIRNLAAVATPVGHEAVRGPAMRTLLTVENAAIAVADGRIVWVGRERDLPVEMAGFDEVDGELGTAVPGFVDSHTHLPFAGYRESEFNRRIHGETYTEIAESGGGIASTVRSTREASLDELAANVVRRARTMVEYGTTTAEAKSGYGLNFEVEMRQLEAIEMARADSPVRLVATCLAAHDFPPEVDRSKSKEREEWIEEIIGRILPEVRRRDLAKFCDVFVEKGVFGPEEGRRILEAGIANGLIPRVHADELSDSDSAAMAVEFGASSADHLMWISERGIKKLAKSSTVANLLPGTSFFLMSDRFAPARRLIDEGAIVSLSTDCNPGSSMTESMQIVMQLATLRMGMAAEEALTAATLNGAASLGIAATTGSLEAGKSADIVVIDAPGYLHLIYHFGVNLVSGVWREGVRVA